MTSTASHTLTDSTPVTVVPQIGTGPANTPLRPEIAHLVERVVVDTNTRLPDMFEITFGVWDAAVAAAAELAIGSVVTIRSPPPAGGAAEDLITGEITALEGEFAATNRMVVRGYTADHRLQRANRNRTFLNATDSDIARQIAGEHRIPLGPVDNSRNAHDHVGQVNQTDWDLLRWRADAIGYDFGVRAGRFYFTSSADVRSAGTVVPLALHETLRSFFPRITSANLASETEVRVWDPMAAKVTSTVVPTAANSADIPAGDPAGMARTFQGRPPTPSPPDPTLAKLGPEPSPHGIVMGHAPVATGRAIDAAADEAVRGAAHHVASTFAEADGEAIGNPALVAGRTIEVSGVGTAFSGRWAVSRATHTYDANGYYTRFEISGRHQRSMLGLSTGGHRGPTTTPRVDGVVCGVVSDIADPERKGRLRVALPWLSPRFESDWAPVAQLGGGARSGTLLHPEVGDEVLVAFELGDPRRPYVLAGLVNDASTHTLGGEPITGSGATSAVVWRGMVTPSGNRLAFHDEVPAGAPPGGPPQASDFVLGTRNAELALLVDQVAGTVTLRCAPKPPGSKSATGTLTIECGQGGTIDIKAGPGGTVNIDGGTALTVKAQASLKVESGGPLEIKGNPIKLN